MTTDRKRERRASRVQNRPRRKESLPELRDSSAEEVNRRDQKLLTKRIDRRAFIRVTLQRLGGAVAFISHVYGARALVKDLWPVDPHSDEELLLDLFGPGEAHSVALIPAADHNWKTPPPGMYWYPLDGACAEAYRERFFRQAVFRTVPGFPNVGPEDSLGLFGSQVSNLSTRLLLGNPFGEEPRLDATQPGWTTQLSWNVHAPPGSPMTQRQQFGVRWREANYVIVDKHGNRFEPRAGMGWIEDDYLLITVLPRYSKGPQRVIVFAGCHGEGTLAAAKILADPPVHELRKIEKCIHGEAWYQALFHITVKRSEGGEFRPALVELIDARPLLVSYSSA